MTINKSVQENTLTEEAPTLHIDQFDYQLPPALIAQTPLEKRDACKLLHVNRDNGQIKDCQFTDILKYLKKGDRLIFNDTKVIPARIYGKKSNGVRIEFLFIEKIDELTWVSLVGPARRLPVGQAVEIENCPGVFLRVEDALSNGDRIVRLISDRLQSVEELLEQYGHLPLPHYIERSDNELDREKYQTVYAANSGAVAAPTAGLHFTDELIAQLGNAGIDISFLTLHVGIGTFRPVKESDPRKHPMHEERFILSQKTVNEIECTRKNGGRIIAVGTTVVRVLEHCALHNGILEAKSGKTRLLILPPYDFKVVDGLITNFHLPKSTLLMLVCALGGTEKVLKAYKAAVSMDYRFYSYGDAMLIL